MRLEQIEKVCTDVGIILEALPENIKNIEGIAVNYKGENMIFYNPQLEGIQQLRVIAHEIGHHVLKHLTQEKSDTVREIEADIFASVFTAMSLFAKTAAA